MKRLNNKTLSVILLVLLAAFALTRVFRSRRMESNVKTDLFTVDTAQVTEIKIHPRKQPGKEVVLTREGKQWEVKQEQKTAEADDGAVHDLLGAVAHVTVQRMVSRKKKDWHDYDIDDTSGTHVQLYAGSALLEDCWIGKSSAGAGPYMQGSSYIRIENKPEVYQAAAGYLASFFDKTYDEWRNHAFLRLNKNEITGISFQYAGDSSFTAEKKDNAWMIGDEQADSARMAAFLNRLKYKNLYSFADGFSPAGTPDAVITIDRHPGPPAVIRGWKEKDAWVLATNLRKGVYFSGKGSDIVKDLLVGKKALLKPAGKQ